MILDFVVAFITVLTFKISRQDIQRCRTDNISLLNGHAFRNKKQKAIEKIIAPQIIS